MNKSKNEKIKKMSEGGKKLAQIKDELKNAVSDKVSPWDIEVLANKLIDKSGGKASFKMVPKYNWATCVNINQGVVHGIPTSRIKFQKDDIVSVDVGLFYKGYHTDTSFTVSLSKDPKINKFLLIGKSALKNAISQAKPGNRIYDLSREMQKTVEAGGYNVVRSLVGHGVGEKLHEDPQIPCFVYGKRDESPLINEGDVYAIEIMYTQGNSDLHYENDGWTISTADDKISALFEETVAVLEHGPSVLTSI